MSRTAIFTAIFDALNADSALFTLLGAKTSGNFRLYRSFPQFQSALSNYEPQPSGEGWLVLQEIAPSASGYSRQYETTYEVLPLQFHIFATRLQICDDVAALLDATWHWSVLQQRDVVYAEYILLRTRRFSMHEQYAQDVKLHQKILSYWQEYTLAIQLA